MEDKIRKNWLIALCIVQAGGYLLDLLDLILGPYIDGYSRVSETGLPYVVIQFLITGPLINFVTFYAVYHFVYIKKRIDVLVGFALIALFSAFVYLYNLISIGLYDWQANFLKCPVGKIYLNAFFFYTCIYFIFHSYKLYTAYKNKDMIIG